MIIYVILITICFTFVLHLNGLGRYALPDSKRYYSPEHLPMPFHLRWLLRFICRQNETAWNIFTIGSLVLIPPATYYFLLTNGLTEVQSLIGSILVLGLPIYHINFTVKYMPDGFGILMSILSATFFTQGNFLFGMTTSLVGSMASEKVFIYAFLFSLNPLALIGGIAVLARYYFPHPEEDVIQERPELKQSAFRLGMQFHRGEWLDATKMVLTWGVGVFCLFNMNLLLAITLIISYAMMLIATDRVRLYQWAFPLVLLSVAQIPIPVIFVLPLIVLHLFNPYAFKWYILTVGRDEYDRRVTKIDFVP